MYIIKSRGLLAVATAALAGLLGARDASAMAVSVIGEISQSPVSPAVVVFRDVTTDGTNAYMTGGGIEGIYSVPLTGGTPTLTYPGSAYSLSGSAYPQDITTLAGNLFWADPQSGFGTGSQVLRAPSSGAGPVTNTGSQGNTDVWGMETDGTSIFMSDAVAGRVQRMNPDGSGRVQIGPALYASGFGDSRENAIALGDGLIFAALSSEKTSSISCFECNFTPRILTHDATDPTGAWATLVSGGPLAGDGPQGIAYGDGSVFVTLLDSILEFDLTGALLNTFTDPLFNNLHGLTFHDGLLYVTDDYAGTDAYAVRLLKVDLSPEGVPAPSVMPLVLIGLAVMGLSRRKRTTA